MNVSASPFLSPSEKWRVKREEVTSFGSLVGSSGLEPPTSRLSGARSNHLSYEPMLVFGVSRLSNLSRSLGLVEMMGIEPMTPCLQGRCSPSWATPPFGVLCLEWSWSVIQNWTTNESSTHSIVHSSRRLFWFWSITNTSCQLLRSYLSCSP